MKIRFGIKNCETGICAGNDNLLMTCVFHNCKLCSLPSLYRTTQTLTLRIAPSSMQMRNSQVPGIFSPRRLLLSALCNAHSATKPHAQSRPRRGDDDVRHAATADPGDYNRPDTQSSQFQCITNNINNAKKQYILLSFVYTPARQSRVHRSSLILLSQRRTALFYTQLLQSMLTTTSTHVAHAGNAAGISK